mmetsp:Transcript_73425/g.215317  ORF Transcript_73425/g.215317 Transcript_73425/m.215317 type:complete len:236 (+) Transcript_73425:1246-1953(+)
MTTSKTKPQVVERMELLMRLLMCCNSGKTFHSRAPRATRRPRRIRRTTALPKKARNSRRSMMWMTTKLKSNTFHNSRKKPRRKAKSFTTTSRENTPRQQRSMMYHVKRCCGRSSCRDTRSVAVTVARRTRACQQRESTQARQSSRTLLQQDSSPSSVSVLNCVWMELTVLMVRWPRWPMYPTSSSRRPHACCVSRSAARSASKGTGPGPRGLRGRLKLPLSIAVPAETPTNALAK